MSTRSCKVCGRTGVRSGRRAHVVDERGKLVRAIVCLKCAGEGLCIVLKRPEAKEERREVRNPQLDAIKRKLQVFRALAEKRQADSPTGIARAQQIETYDQCIALVEAAQEGRPI